MAQPRVLQGTLCCSTQEGTGCLPAGQCPAGREGERLGQLVQVGANRGVPGSRGWRWEGRFSPPVQAGLAEPAGGRGGSGHSPRPRLPRRAEAGGYWQSMNVSNRCASCSGADVSSMRGAEPCALPGGAAGPARPWPP